MQRTGKQHNTTQQNENPTETNWKWMFLFLKFISGRENILCTHVTSSYPFLRLCPRRKTEDWWSLRKTLASHSICTLHIWTSKTPTKNNFKLENVLFAWIHSLSLLFSISCVAVLEMQIANCKLQTLHSHFTLLSNFNQQFWIEYKHIRFCSIHQEISTLIGNMENVWYSKWTWIFTHEDWVFNQSLHFWINDERWACLINSSN